MEAVPVGCVVRSCAEEATAVLRDGVADGHSRRRQQLRRATRTTPRRGYVASSILDLPELAEAARALLHAGAEACPSPPTSDLHRRVARTVPRGFAATHLAVDEPEAANHATDVRAQPARSEHLLADLELEPDGAGWRLLGVRPWLSTLLGCDARDEAAHRSLLVAHLATGIGGGWGYVAAVPGGSWPLRERVLGRLEAVRSAVGAHVLRIHDIGDPPPPIAFGHGPRSASVRAYDPRSGLPLRVLLPIAANLRDWPAWLLGWVEDQDRVRLALHRALVSGDLGRPGALHEPSTIGGVVLGRRRVALEPGCSRQEVLDACDLVASGGLVAVRQARTDRGFVADRRRDEDTIVDTVRRESVVQVVVEAPPRALRDAYASGAPHHVETVTWMSQEGAGTSPAIPHGVLATSASGLRAPWGAGPDPIAPTSLVLDARATVTRSTVVAADGVHDLVTRTDLAEHAITLRAALVVERVDGDPDLRDRLASELAGCGRDDLDHAALLVIVRRCASASRAELAGVAGMLGDARLVSAGPLWRALMTTAELRAALLEATPSPTGGDGSGLLDVAVALARLQSDLERSTTWPDLLRRVAVAHLRTGARTTPIASPHAR